MRTLDQIYGCHGVLYVMTSAGVLVQVRQEHIDVVIDYWQGWQLQLSVFGETVRDLMLAGF